MNLWFPIFAEIKTDGGLLENNAISSSVREFSLVLFGVIAIAIGLIIWAGFIRKRRHHLYSGGQRRRHHHRHHHHHHRDDRDATAEDEEVTSSPREEREPDDSSSESDHSGKPRRRKYRRRFPTLAQTGGLPPKRPFLEESSDNGNPHAKD